VVEIVTSFEQYSIMEAVRAVLLWVIRIREAQQFSGRLNWQVSVATEDSTPKQVIVSVEIPTREASVV
jgi:hypothetical protein